MQRITLAFLIFLVSSAFSSTSSQTQIKNLNEYKAKPRVFKPIGCKYTDVPGQECQHKVLVNNYDMEPSIARSDTFDINHYDGQSSVKLGASIDDISSSPSEGPIPTWDDKSWALKVTKAGAWGCGPIETYFFGNHAYIQSANPYLGVPSGVYWSITTALKA